MSRAVTVPAIDRILEDPIAGMNDGIGFVGPDVPVEVLLATGRAFGHLPWLTEAPTPFADSVLERSFPFWARSLLEQWHSGAFDGLSTVVFSRAADASQRLYYYISELQRRGRLGGPSIVVFDIAHVPRKSGLAYTADAIRRLGRGLDVGSERLLDAVERANTLRQKLAGITADRTGDGPQFEHVGRAALWSDPSPWIDEVSGPAQHSSMPVLLVGSVPPDDRIHVAVEEAGASVVAEAHMYPLTRLGPEVSVNGEGVPLSEGSVEIAIARQLRSSSPSPRAWPGQAKRVADLANDVGAAAVIIWLTREDEALAWQVPMQEKLLDEQGVPTLVLPASDWRFGADQRDRLTRFLREGTVAPA